MTPVAASSYALVMPKLSDVKLDDESRPVEVHRIVALLVDHDRLGAERCGQLLESTRYANHSPAPTVMQIETVTVPWTDRHPLNYPGPRQRAAADALFARTTPADDDLALYILQHLESRNGAELRPALDSQTVESRRRCLEELALILAHRGKPPNWI